MERRAEGIRGYALSFGMVLTRHWLGLRGAGGELGADFGVAGGGDGVAVDDGQAEEDDEDGDEADEEAQCELNGVGLDGEGLAGDGVDVAGGVEDEVGEGGASDSYYFSTWRRRSGWGLTGSPDQTLWGVIQKLPLQSELVGLLPYQDTLDRVTIGMYFRFRQDGIYHYHFANYDGSPNCEAFPLSEFPLLVRTAHYVDDSVPPSPRRLTEGVMPWALHPADQGDHFKPCAENLIARRHVPRTSASQSRPGPISS